MVQFQGFKTKEEAQAFIKKNGKGLLCYESSETEKRGLHPQDYRDCVVYGGLSREYPYAVQWRGKMTLSELKNTAERLIQTGHGDDTVVITLAEPSVGCRAFTEVSDMHAGFDWEAGQVRIAAEKKILSYDKDRDGEMKPVCRDYTSGNRTIHIRSCPKCGEHLRKDDRYCSRCGQRVSQG